MRMRLTDYIADMGDRAFAEMIGVSRRVATDWRLGTRTPRPETAQRIVKRSHGKVSMTDIYGGNGKARA